MEQEDYSFVHDTIDLDEIKKMLEGNETPKSAEEPQEKPVEKPVEKQEKTLPSNPPAEVQKSTWQKMAKEKKKTKEPKKPGEEVYGIVHDLVYILVAVTVLFVFLVRLVGVDGRSMLPTLHHMDFLLLESNFLYGEDDIESGDIVVLHVPYYAERLIVKRVIATEGQTVDIDFEKGQVYVDGTPLKEDYTNTPTNYNGYLSVLNYPVTVPEGCIFVLGDNRNDSMDSRFAMIGMIDTRCILGKVRAIVLPGQTKDDYGNITDPRDWSRIGLVS